MTHSNSNDSPRRHAHHQGQVGDYRLLERLGTGGMGEVWLARRETGFGNTNKIVALKLMTKGRGHDSDARRLFQTEARLSMMLSHSNIVQVFDVGDDGDQCYMAMEWVDGVDLESVLSFLSEHERALEPELIAYIIGELLNALSYAHRLREGAKIETVIHRDISPHNVLTSVSGEVKIADFGIARLRSEATSGVHVRGKLRYMPPEQVRSASRRPTIDLFAVGAVFFELLTNQLFRSAIPSERLFTAVAGGYVPPTHLPGLPAALQQLLDELLEPDPERRIQSAEDALHLLRSWPGYRNCRAELAALTREISGIEGPRSGLSISGQDSDYEASTSVWTSTVQRTHMVPSSESPRSNPSAVTAVELTARAATIEDSGPSRPQLGTVLSFVGLGLILGLGLPLGLTHLDPATQPTEASLAPSPVHRSPPALFEYRWIPWRAPPSLAPTRTGAPRLATTERPTRPAPTKVAPRVPVMFTSGEFHWLSVAVAGRELDLDPRVETHLPAGRHNVEIRVGSDTWRPVGQLVLEAGQRYQVDFLEPASFRTQRLEREAP